MLGSLAVILELITSHLLEFEKLKINTTANPSILGSECITQTRYYSLGWITACIVSHCNLYVTAIETEAHEW